jgi:hypothetical protein
MQNPVLKKEFDAIINKREFHSNVTRLLQNQFGDHIVDFNSLMCVVDMPIELNIFNISLSPSIINLSRSDFAR